MTSKSNAIKSIFGFSLPTWINAIIGILAVPLVTRLFAPDVLGRFSIFCTYSTILSCVALAGLNQGFMRFYHEPPGRNSIGGLFRICMALTLSFALIITVVIFVFGGSLSNVIAGTYDLYVLICLVVTIMAAVLLNMVNSAYRMQNKLLAYGVLTVLMNLCAKITYVGAALVNNQFTGAITLFTASYAIIATFYIIYVQKSFKGQNPVFGKRELSPLLKYSLPLMPVLFISQINTALPKLAIAEYLDYSQVGIYASAYSVVSIISIIQSGINTFWTPFVFENFAIHPRYLSSGHLIITFAMVIFGFSVILFQDVIYMIIGPSYRASQQFFALMLFPPICYTISETTGIGINLSKKTYFNLIVYGVTIAITFAACYLLIPYLGLLGAAIAVAIAAFCMLIIKTMIGEKLFKVITNPLKSFLAPTILLVTLSINTVFFDRFLLRTIITIIAGITICIIYRKEMFLLLGMIKDFFISKRQES